MKYKISMVLLMLSFATHASVNEFPKCSEGKSTKSVTVADLMFQQVLGLPSAVGKNLVENLPHNGSKRGAIALGRTSNNELTLVAYTQNKSSGQWKREVEMPAQVCQKDARNLVAKISGGDHKGREFRIEKRTAPMVYVDGPSFSGTTNTYTIMNKLPDAATASN